MSRVKLSEYRAKKLLFEVLRRQYDGLAIDLKDKDYPDLIKRLPARQAYVTKVDQAIKKRGLSGLVKVNRSKKQVLEDLKYFARKGFRYALVEPYVPHAPNQEHYVAFLRAADGVELKYTPKGGMEVESQGDSIQHALLSAEDYDSAQNTTGLDNTLGRTLFDLFQKTHMTLLEINPFVAHEGGYLPLDAAVEVDSSAVFFVDGLWGNADIRTSSQPSGIEHAVEVINSKSPASLSLRVLNPDGSIFLLLSGGGASIVVADELSYLKRHKAIANYGEYSGNPTTEETYLYTKEVLRLMLNSKARKKSLVIAGGVANFTDVAKTFAGIIRAMDELAPAISKQKIRVFVRRGGPNQQKGLEAMARFLERIDVPNKVYGPEESLATVIKQVAGAQA